MKAKPKNANDLILTAQPGESSTRCKARNVLRPTIGAGVLVAAFGHPVYGELDLQELVGELGKQCSKVRGGNMARVESMLLAQAHSLDAIFTHLARRAARAKYMPQLEGNLRLALKAQSQCRATLETLAAIKNPPVFAKQANIAHGPQQVNNESAPVARAEQIGNQPTEVLEHDHGERLDTRTATAAGGSDQAMGTVAAIHRPANCKQQGRRQP